MRINSSGKAVKAVERVANYQFREHNSSIAGGLAQGIGGVGAGLAAYARTEQGNAATRAAKNNFLRQANSKNESTNLHYKLMKDKVIKFINWYAPWLDNVMVDTVSNDYFDHVTLSVVEQTDTDYYMSGYIGVRIKPQLDQEQYSLLNYPARLDGTVRVEVYEDGNKVGTGYYSPDGYGATNLAEVGFGSDHARWVMIKPDSSEIELDKDKEYEYKFIPETLWLVQAKDIGDAKRNEFEVSKIDTMGWRN